MNTVGNKAAQKIVTDYIAATPRSRAHFDKARHAVTGGTSRGVNCWEPHPIYAASGKGATITDLDGREYVDFLNNYTALIHGHGDPTITEAISCHLYSGTVHSLASPLEAEFAALLIERIPSVERIRFTATGTEAVMYATRLARAATGRQKIAKMDGGFHGTFDGVSVSIPPLTSSADPQAPPVVADGDGISADTVRNVIALPFNDIAHTTALVEANADDLAALVVEPVLCVGGMVPANAEYLYELRRLCDRHGIVLIFDEVVTLRLAPGGAQQRYGVTPDLTVLSKIIGGGLPLAAIGGRTALMDVLARPQWRDDRDGPHAGVEVFQRGTFHGYPAALAAGIATLRRLTPAEYERINAIGDAIRSRINAADLPVCASGVGSLLAVHFMPDIPETGRDMRHLHTHRQHSLFLAMLLEGFMIAPRGLACVSTPMDESVVDGFIDALRNAVGKIL